VAKPQLGEELQSHGHVAGVVNEAGVEVATGHWGREWGAVEWDTRGRDWVVIGLASSTVCFSLASSRRYMQILTITTFNYLFIG